MNRNFLIAIVIAAAALVAYFILSSPSPTDTPTGNTGAGAGTGTGTGAGNSANNPLSQLLSGVLTQQGPNAGVQTETPIQTARVFVPNFGWVKVFNVPGVQLGATYYILESTTEKVMPGSDTYNAIKAALAEMKKIRMQVDATV